MELMEIWVQTGTLNTLPHVATRRIELFLLREDTEHKLRRQTWWRGEDFGMTDKMRAPPLESG